MIVWLDHKIFGSGHGLSSPFWDSNFLWLVDTYQKERSGKNGQFYHFFPGLGAQLSSFQWTHPNAGEERVLGGKRFRPLHSTRRWFRVRVSWSWRDLPSDIGEANIALRKLEKELTSTI